jgi:hypothetical protein
MKTRHYVTMGVLVLVAACVNVWSPWDGGVTGGRISVRGEVTLNGKPLKSGRIQFTPDRNTAAPAVPGKIENGNFHIRAAQGLLPGTYAVTITLPGPSKRDMAPPLNSTTRDRQSVNDHREPASAKVIQWPVPQVVEPQMVEVELNFALPPQNVAQR